MKQLIKAVFTIHGQASKSLTCLFVKRTSEMYQNKMTDKACYFYQSQSNHLPVVQIYHGQIRQTACNIIPKIICVCGERWGGENYFHAHIHWWFRHAHHESKDQLSSLFLCNCNTSYKPLSQTVTLTHACTCTHMHRHTHTHTHTQTHTEVYKICVLHMWHSASNTKLDLWNSMKEISPHTSHMLVFTSLYHIH